MTVSLKPAVRWSVLVGLFRVKSSVEDAEHIDAA